METSKALLVPFDFTIVAEYAFAHAVNISKETGEAINLLHVVSKKEDSESTRKSLDEISSELARKYSISKPGIIIKTGTINDAITEAAMEQNIFLIVMGTHGDKGWQKIFGSRALRVMIGSKVPFLVVQDFPVKQKVENVVIPIDFRVEAREKIKWTELINDLYHSNFSLIHTASKDPSIKLKTSKNLMFFKRAFDANGIKYNVEIVEGKGGFSRKILRYADNAKADLIIINTVKGLNTFDMLFGSPEQIIIANKSKIPVMVITPRPPILGSGFSTTGN
jgi:nucleotide-binding universal stress UspA family protein